MPLSYGLQNFICIRNRSFPAQKIARVMKAMSNGRSSSTIPAEFQSLHSTRLAVPVFCLADTCVPYEWQHTAEQQLQPPPQYLLLKTFITEKILNYFFSERKLRFRASTMYSIAIESEEEPSVCSLKEQAKDVLRKNCLQLVLHWKRAVV